MNARKIREDLGRIKTCIQRRDYPRALYLFCVSVKDLGGQAAPMDLRGDFRSALAELCSDPIYKKEYPQPLSYQPGKERDLFIFLNSFYKQLMGAENKEDYETTLQRKLALDHGLNDGKTFLKQGQPSEADNSFNEALKYYKNEFAVYGMMAKAMLEAGHPGRAIGYIRKGLAERKDDQGLLKLLQECERLRAKDH